ncbi:MAG: methyltransferase type 11, partial [Burkholderiales bacterium]|nr:methyltransferase type 11 [Burkholderiales bacterium]
KRVDGVVSRIRGYGAEGLHFRSPEDWSMLLAREGFSVHAVPMERGTPFANVLHVAQLSPA